MLNKLRFDERGGLAVSFALGSTALLMVAGGTIDVGTMVLKRSELQALADSAALAGARQLTVANVTKSQIVSVAEAFVKYHSDSGDGLQTAVRSDLRSEVTVRVTEAWRPIFAHLFSDNVTPLAAAATAKVYGTGSVCVLGLDETSTQTITLSNKAILTAKSCNVISNSTDSRSLVVVGDARMTAQNIYTAGGYSGTTSAFSPAPVEDSSKMDDPLAGRPAPDFAGCDKMNSKFSKGSITLFPGVYCGGLNISGNARVTLKPGNYIIKNGPLAVTARGSITGENVGFYLTGKGSNLLFTMGSSISLTAPKEGALAGLLFYQDPNASGKRVHRIGSDNARLLLGTVYLPNGNLIVDANKPVADQSAYTAIIVRKLVLMAGPNLVLNADYGATEIPAPTGLSEGKVSLVK